MKVLHVIPSLSLAWGGPVAVVANLTQGLASKGIGVSLFSTAGRRVGEQSVTLGGVAARTFKTGQLARLWTGYAPNLAEALRADIKDYDILHIHELWNYPHYAAYRAARHAHKPYVVTVHGALSPWALGLKGLRKRVYFAALQHATLNNAAAIHAVTQGEREQVKAQRLKAPIVVIPNGIHPGEFQNLPPRQEFVDKHPELAGKSVVLFLGRLHPIKGLDLLARAFGAVAQARKDVHLLIVGPDEVGYRAAVEGMIRGAGTENNATFTGPLMGRDKLAALAAADIFVLPSYSEGFSVTVLEAMACGLPVVISRQCFFPEVEEAGAGLVIDTQVEQLAGALTRLIGHPELRKEMGERGKRLVQERYTWDKVVDQIVEMYQSVLGQAKSGVSPARVS